IARHLRHAGISASKQPIHGFAHGGRVSASLPGVGAGGGARGMKSRFNIQIFTHSLISDWNHGNAHFLRALARDIGKMGHEVRCHEELGSWSLRNLVQNERERSIAAIDEFRDTFQDLRIFFYRNDSTLQTHLEEQLANADIVIIHEWNEPEVVNSILDLKKRFGFRALFHDT